MQRHIKLRKFYAAAKGLNLNTQNCMKFAMKGDIQ